MERTYIVLNPHTSTYELRRANTLQLLARDLGCDEIDENGTYISHATPDYQVIDVGDSTVFDLR
ncbi:MAG: hypothetical protein QNI96_05165 [Woeseiaceae bacterium]|nr:hypothetical protein [Woeseiaceae bacterium]